MSIKSELIGKIQSKCTLSDMPDLTLYFKDSSLLDDVSFHPCVRYKRFEEDKILSFVPPDGDFQLLSYRVKNVQTPPVYCRAQISFSNGVGNIQIMSNLKSYDFVVEDVKIVLQLPKDTIQSKVTTNYGNVKFNNSTKELVWEIGKFSKNSTPSASGQVILSHKNEVEIPNVVNFKFRIPSIAYSGLKVDQVNVSKVDYKPYKGVRYVTIASDFQIRTC
jgi:AP-3 complex subunit mu